MMKMKKGLIVLVFVLFSTSAFTSSVFAGDYQFYFFGINAKFFKEASWEQVALGVVASAATHWVAHVAYGKAIGGDIRINGLTENMVLEGRSTAEKANFHRAGFLAQSIVGLALTSFETSRGWDFTHGYVALSAAEVWTYPVIHTDNGDIESLGLYTNGDFEWAGYSAVALHNVLRVNWEK